MLEEHLITLGYKRKLPWQFMGDSYFVVRVEDADSYDFEIWSITNKRFDQVVFRGRIRSAQEFDYILLLVKEDYDLRDDEIIKLRGV